jgi:hypothetical protein
MNGKRVRSVGWALTTAILLSPATATAQTAPAPKLFAKENLVAWCIVPFDAKKRSPAERAAMLKRLGFTKFAYDYRAEHIPTFDAEIAALQKQEIELTAWCSDGDARAAAAARHLRSGPHSADCRGRGQNRLHDRALQPRWLVRRAGEPAGRARRAEAAERGTCL